MICVVFGIRRGILSMATSGHKALLLPIHTILARKFRVIVLQTGRGHPGHHGH